MSKTGRQNNEVKGCNARVGKVYAKQCVKNQLCFPEDVFDTLQKCVICNKII